MKPIRLIAFTMFATLSLVLSAKAADPLPSWNDGPAKKAIVEFVSATTEKSSPRYVDPEDRIAVFDNDGTLWGGATALFPASLCD